MKRFLKYLSRTILAVFILLFLTVLSLYLPPVQDLIRKQAVKYVTTRYGWDVKIEKLAIGFPFDLKIENVYAGKTATDTLVSVGVLQLEIGIKNILQSELALRELVLDKVKFVLPGDSTTLNLVVDAGMMNVKSGHLNLKKKLLEVEVLTLENSAVLLGIGGASKQDSVKTNSIDWTFAIRQIDLKQVDFEMKSVSMPYLGAGIGVGSISRGRISLGKQSVDVGDVMLDQAWCDIKTNDNGKDSAKIVNAGQISPDSLKTLWTVTAGSLYMKNSAFNLMTGQEKRAAINLSGIGIRIDSVYNRGTVVRAHLQELQAVQQNGVEVKDLKAEIDLDSADSHLGNVYIRTQNSTINMNVHSNASVSNLWGTVPLEVTLDARLGLADLEPFYAGIPRRIKNKSISVKTAFRLTSDQVRVEYLDASMPGHLKMNAKGSLSSFRNFKTASGDIYLQGVFPDITFLNAMLKGNRVNVPRNMTFSGNFRAVKGMMDVSGRLCQEKGCLVLNANYNIPAKIYNASLELDAFPLNRFLPADSLGKASVDIRLAGRDFSWRKAEVEVKTEIREFEYKRHPYRDIRLDASLSHTRFIGELKSLDPDANIELTFNGDSIGDQYQTRIKGKIRNIDLKKLNLMQLPLALGVGVDILAAESKDNVYTLHVGLDSIRMTDSIRQYELGDIRLEMDSDTRKTKVEIVSGDFNLDFRSDTALINTGKLFGMAAKEIKQQTDKLSVDWEKIAPNLPKFVLDVKSGQNNTVAKYLKAREIGFRDFSIGVSSKQKNGIRLTTRINAPYYKEVRLDSAQVSVWQRNKSLVYSMDVNGSANIEKGPFSVNVSGNLLGDHLRMELKQKDGKGELGFDLGAGITMSDSLFAINLFPMTPILGYRRWIVNPDNQIVIKKNRQVDANLRLTNNDKLINIQSLGDEGELKERLKVEIKGVDLGELTRLSPFFPELAGQLNTDLLIYGREDALGISGNIKINNFYYQNQRIGSVGLFMTYSLGQSFSAHAVDFELKLDSVRKAVVKGEFSTAENNKDVFVDMNITDFPLYVVNAFMPDNLMKFQGELKGNMRFRGTLDAPELNGDLAFHDGQAELLMLGTVFSLDSSRILIRDNKVRFNRYRFIAPDKSILTVNGDINLTPFNQIRTDLSVVGNNFQVVNVKQNPSSLIFGKAYVNINARLMGTFSALSVTGNVNLLNNTAITYTLRNSNAELQDKSIDLVRFVSFQDTTRGEQDDLTNRLKVNDFMLKMLVEIGNSVSMSVYLSEDGQDNILIQGGGNLILAMNPENGLTLAGKYILTNGNVTYNIPVAGKKVFNIQTGSYVEWSGDVANPRLNISANEQVKASVEDGDRNRLVTFESIIRIQNTLAQPEITFDLSAPSDMVIQNQLATFSPEERSKQAMNLLIYGTYTGPGAASSSGNNVANNALYGFVENELNKYTRKTGLTFGFDSYNTTSETTRTDFTYQFSKQLFNDKISVKIGGRVSSDNNDVNAGNLEDNLVDDISIEYTFTKKKNLFLKVFRHSNYESVLEGEVTQTGIGIVWRKSYRKLKDLFIRKEKREVVKSNNER